MEFDAADELVMAMPLIETKAEAADAPHASPPAHLTAAHSGVAVGAGTYQAAFLAIGIVCCLAVMGENRDARAPFNMDDPQLQAYMTLAAFTGAFLLLDAVSWASRVRALEEESSKDRELLKVEHDADIVPVVESGWRASRLLSVMSFYSSMTLAGASLPAASMMLAAETPAHGTLRAAWLMSFSALCSAFCCAVRQLAPFLAGSTFVGTGNAIPPVSRRMVLAAPFFALVVFNSVVAGVALTATVRPLSAIYALPVLPSIASIPAPLAYGNSSSAHAFLSETLMHQHPMGAYRDVERDAMAVISVLAGLTVWAWVLCSLIVAWPDFYAKGARRRKLVAVVGCVACSSQAALLGTVCPLLAVVGPGGTRMYADNMQLTSQAAGTKLYADTDALSKVIAALVIGGTTAHVALCMNFTPDTGG